MVAMLLAYDAAGNVVATLDYLVARDAAGEVIGLVDFEAHETASGALTDIWTVTDATGSGTWPEFLGARAHEFRVERSGGRISALVHATSGHRRERAAIEAAIAATPVVEDERGMRTRDIRHLVGGPTAHLELDEHGRTIGRAKRPSTPAHLPLLGAG